MKKRDWCGVVMVIIYTYRYIYSILFNIGHTYDADLLYIPNTNFKNKHIYIYGI